MVGIKRTIKKHHSRGAAVAFQNNDNYLHPPNLHTLHSVISECCVQTRDNLTPVDGARRQPLHAFAVHNLRPTCDCTGSSTASQTDGAQEMYSFFRLAFAMSSFIMQRHLYVHEYV